MKKAKGLGLGFGIYLMMACAVLGALTSTVYGDSRAPHGGVEPTSLSGQPERSLEESLLDFAHEAYQAYVAQLSQIKQEMDALRAKMDARTASTQDFARYEQLTDELKVKNTTLTQMVEILSKIMRDMDKIIERAARSEGSRAFLVRGGSPAGDWQGVLSQLHSLQGETRPQDFELSDLLRTLIELSQTMNQFATAYAERLENH